MQMTGTANAIELRNILYLTDFSDISTKALPFAVLLARNFGATIHALHVLTPVIPESCPEAIKADDELAEMEMQKIEPQLAGVDHDTRVIQGMEVWPAIEQAITKQHIDLIVLGTHGRSGATKLLMGSIAEEIFRRSPVPVLTIGPETLSARAPDGLRRVLFATDFSPHSVAAASYAASIAQERRARLVLVHVIRKRGPDGDGEVNRFEMSVAEAIHHLYETIPQQGDLEYPPEVAVEFGEPADRILEAARQRNVDFIVMGVRSAEGHLGAATHLERPVAHKVVAHAPCPVLTVRA